MEDFPFLISIIDSTYLELNGSEVLLELSLVLLEALVLVDILCFLSKA